MASTLNCLLSIRALRSTHQIRSRKIHKAFQSPRNNFHISFSHHNDVPKPSSIPNLIAGLDPATRTMYESLSPEERAEFERDLPIIHAHMTSPQVESSLSAEISSAAYEVEEEAPEAQLPFEKPFKPGFFAMGEEDERDAGEDDEFEGDDITPLGHGELEQHREIREYYRIAAWEMPLLSKLAKPFTPPSLSTPLRFRHTSYMGESHPAANKISLEFCTADLPLTPPQRLKLVKLLGVRYDPQQDLVKMSCETFATQAQNKHYLKDVVNTLVREARGEGETKDDDFADVPVDFRHVKWKKRLMFPPEWRVTRERRAWLVREWERGVEGDRERIAEGRMVDGVKLIEAAMRKMPVLQPESGPLERSRRLAKGKPSRRPAARNRL